MSDWIGLPETITDENFGFIYMITNKVTGKKYIGKKQFWSTLKRPPLKGKLRSRKVIKESDYKTYYGSSEALKHEVAEMGKENYLRELLAITSCKWEASYLELLFQLKHNVICSDEFINGILNVRLIKMPKHLREKYKNLKIDFTF